MTKVNHKYHRGDRFIIEIAEVHTHYTDTKKPYSLYRVKGFDSLVLTDNALDKLEQIINCKDCENWLYNEDIDAGDCGEIWKTTYGDGFCHCAVRKDGSN